MILAPLVCFLQNPDWPAGKNIQRTMSLLATSSPQHHNRVKVLFYGQSITKQDWWLDVDKDLRTRFPYADLTCKNLAIGGFDASRLKKALQHDVYAEYPDLIILHDYGGEPDYEDLIRKMRSHVSSEILVQSDHYVDAPPRTEAWHDQHVGWLRNLADKYSLGFVDVRTPWKAYLQDHRLAPGALLMDGVHLNRDGCTLMASLVKQALVYNPSLPAGTLGVKTERVRWSGHEARIGFDGNRVDLECRDLSAPVEVRIDGKRPSELPELYAITRPSECFAVDVPEIYEVDHTQPLLLEDWTVQIFDIAPDVSKWRFRVAGSVTGQDGEGSSDRPFVSNSGRVVISPDSWYTNMAYQISKKRPPVGHTITWKVVPQFVDSLPAGLSETVTLAQGLPNGRHILELTSESKVKGVRATTAYQPPLSP